MLIFILILSLLFIFSYVQSNQNSCEFHDLSPPIHAILCAVENGLWKVTLQADKYKKKDCLLGKNRCDAPMSIPTISEVPPSPPPPNARNPQYQELALKAEKVVPKIWWRDGFASEKLLLSKGNDDLPKKLFDSTSTLSNKKLKNIYQCVTRQQFMRRSYDFRLYKVDNMTNISSRTGKDQSNVCIAMESQVVKDFFKLWHSHRNDLDGSYSTGNDGKTQVWFPKLSNQGQLVMAASEVMEHFYMNYGGVWTGCFAYEKFPECRGAMAAAALVSATQIAADIAGRQKTFTDTLFTKGYILASLGRALLHGDLSSSGNVDLTSWKVKLTDFIGLQSAFLKLYIDSYGKIYNDQLNENVPFAFSGDFPVVAKRHWKDFSQSLEPVYTSVRNWMFTECSNLIDFSPYRPIVAFHEVRKKITENKNQFQKRVLIDVGANGFFASPKFLIDHYSVYMPFTDVIMIEPEPHFSATIPPVYSSRYNISFLQIYAEVATGSKTDIIKLLPTIVSKNDFVVLKFDVDPNRYAYGPTMEWGFLFEIMQNPDVAMLVDEVYIELHFNFPSLFWKHYHSNWEALDTFRYLRNNGVIVHSWP